MKNLNDIGMIAADTSRSRVYIQSLINAELYPSYVLILKNSSNTNLPGQINKIEYEKGNYQINLSTPIKTSLKSKYIDFEEVDTHDIHEPDIIEKIRNRNELFFIYSGYGGVILKKKLFSTGKYFLHIHGGYLPDYKGSTTNYYSLIKENKIGASSIFLNEKIDSGPLLHRKYFPPPCDRTRIDHFDDSIVRAKVLIETLLKYKELNKFEYYNNVGEGEMYYIIHPLLKHIAILSKN